MSSKVRSQRLAVALILCVTSTFASAQTRPLTTTMSCSAAGALVQANGALILATGRDYSDRYVRGQSFCGTGEAAKASFVPSADNPQCFIGYRCVPISMDR